MRLYNEQQLREAITLAQSFKTSNIEGNFSASGLWQADEIIKELNDKYFKEVDKEIITSKLITSKEIDDNITELIAKYSLNKFKTAISYKVNDTEELKKILNGEK